MIKIVEITDRNLKIILINTLKQIKKIENELKDREFHQ